MKKSLLIIVCFVSVMPAWLFAQGFKSPGAGAMPAPSAPYIVEEGEELVKKSFSPASLEEFQSALDALREANQDATILAVLTTGVEIASTPLRLDSRTVLVFDAGAYLKAANDATATSLVRIEDARSVALGSVSVSERGLLDGGGVVPVGIEVRNSAVVNVYRMELRNFTGDALSYTGRGDNTFGEAGSITASRVHSNGGNGILVRNAAQFICTDNLVHANGSAGIDIDSSNSLVADNSFEKNSIAIHHRSKDSVIARNLLNNNPYGIKLHGSTALNKVTYNRITGSDAAIVLHGTSNILFHNDVADNERKFQSGNWQESATFQPPFNNVVMGHNGVKVSDLVGAPNKKDEDVWFPPEVGTTLYFNPPTIANNHTDEIIVNGMGRFDLEILASPNAKENREYRPKWAALPERIETTLEKRGFMDLTEVQSKIEAARKERPNDYLVVHLYGLFVATKEAPAGLVIPNNTSLLLHRNASLIARYDIQNHETFTKPALVSIEADHFASISGGYLDGGSGRAHRGIEVKGRCIALIDGVTVASFERHGILTFAFDSTAKRTKFYTMERGRPIVAHANNIVNNGYMGLWGHMRNDALYINNVASDNYQGGILHDSNNHNSPALFNVLTGNKRCGLWIELRASDNILYGNYLNGNNGRHSTGVVSYCQFGGPNLRNMIVNNIIVNHEMGVDMRMGVDNIIFGNHFLNNREGFRYGIKNENNLLSQNSFRFNGMDIHFRGSKKTELDCFTFPSASQLTDTLPATER